MIALLFVLTAAAADLPDYPAQHAPSENECLGAIGLSAGQPASVIDANGYATCSGVLLPLSEAAHLIDLRDHAVELRAFIEADQARRAVKYAKAVSALSRERMWSRGATAIALISTSAAVGLGVALSKK